MLNATLHILSRDEKDPNYGYLTKYASKETVRFFLYGSSKEMNFILKDIRAESTLR